MNEDSYRDSYEDGPNFQLPSHLGSHYEYRAGDFIVLDSLTGELLSKKFTILWIDSQEGYFVEKKKTARGIEYIAHKNDNLQVIKDDNFYESDESD